eukprot:COSAG01_NODE_2639_length_7326_cov_15.912550_5_plen_124_part_00
MVATAKAAAEVATSEAEAEAAAARAQLKDRVEVQPFLIARERVRCIQFLAGASHTVLYTAVCQCIESPWSQWTPTVTQSLRPCWHADHPKPDGHAPPSSRRLRRFASEDLASSAALRARKASA